MVNNLVIVKKHDTVLEIKLNNAASRNSLTEEFRAALGHAVTMASSDDSVRAVYLTAEGKSFCAGGDLNALQTACDPWQVHRRFRRLDRWLLPLINLDKPLIVAINGHAVGGGLGLALTGDILIAGEDAKLMAGFFRLGAVPDIATMYHLPRLVGMAQAKNIIFNNLTLNARQAQELGIVSEVVANAELYEKGLDTAMKIAQGPAQVMGLAKTLMARSFETSLNDMIAFEGFGQVLAMSNPEFREGLSAAVEKRPANFLGAVENAGSY